MTLWDERDYPILKAFAEAEGKQQVTSAQIAKEVSRDPGDTWVGLQSLREARFITWGQQTNAYGGNRVILAPRLAERGRKALGQWPDDTYSALVAVLEARINATTDRDERGRLERFRDGLVGMGRDVATDLLAAFLRQTAGL